jgi:F-type H+-transporting ATPase subunit gamma
MAKARAIVKRRKAVQNIRKITRTMQLIATARFQAAFNRAVASRPYTDGITELVRKLSGEAGELDHPLLKQNTESKKSVHIAITANRGLCGGYNAQLSRAAVEHNRTREALGEHVDLYACGKKGIAYFKFTRRPMARQFTQFEDKPRFAEVEPIASELIDAYERKEIDAAYVTYMKFISTGTQRVETMQLLPIEKREAAPEGASQSGGGAQYEFSPPGDELLKELLPQTVKIRLYQCFTDAAVSEQVARMVAMKAATDAAGDMIKSLTGQYNRARQGQITLELLDIVSGAEALNA